MQTFRYKIPTPYSDIMLDFDWLVHASHWITIVLSIILMLGAIIYLFMI